MSQKRSVFAGSTRAVHGAETANSRRITTSAPKSARPRSSSRTGSLCRKHSGFPRSRGDESPGSAASDGLFAVRQHFVLAKSRYLQQLPPAPYIGRRVGRHVNFIPCPFRTGIRFDLLGAPPRFTSADSYDSLIHTHDRRDCSRGLRLHLCKGPFPPFILRFRPWTVFFTTTFTFSYSNVHHEG